MMGGRQMGVVVVAVPRVPVPRRATVLGGDELKGSTQRKVPSTTLWRMRNESEANYNNNNNSSIRPSANLGEFIIYMSGAISKV
jgi:hypothetical protein